MEGRTWRPRARRVAKLARFQCGGRLTLPHPHPLPTENRPEKVSDEGNAADANGEASDACHSRLQAWLDACVACVGRRLSRSVVKARERARVCNRNKHLFLLRPDRAHGVQLAAAGGASPAAQQSIRLCRGACREGGVRW